MDVLRKSPDHQKPRKKGASKSTLLELREDDGLASFLTTDELRSGGDILPNSKKKPKAPREYSAPAVDRTLDVLEYMAKSPQPYGATELSRALKIPLNSVFRILKRLTEREYTTQDPASGGYQLSTKVFSLGMSLYTRYELRQRARTHLEWLSRETAETVQMLVPRGDRMVVLDTISPEVDFYLRVVPGSLAYFHGSAFGKAILAFEEEKRILEILPARLPELTPNTIQLRSEFIKGLEDTRRTGLAYDNEEYIMGIRCVGAPVFDVMDKAVAGLGITGLISTYEKGRMAIFEQLVLECARRVSVDIGYSGTFFNDKLTHAADRSANESRSS